MNQGSNKKPFLSYLYKFVIIIIISTITLHYLFENSSIFYRKSITLPFSMHLNEQDLYLIKGEEYKLSVFAINKRVTYYSTNIRVAGVNFNGRVFGYRTGKAFIIAKVNHKELKCRVHVIDINKKSLVLKTGRTFHLKVKGTYSFATWKSSNKNVAKVNIFGKVEAVGTGTTYIYVKVKGRTLKCKIKVT